MEASTLEKNKKTKLRLLGCDNAHYFFGYYDISPFNSKNVDIVLCMKASCKNIEPGLKEKIEVGYFDLSKVNPVFVKVGETYAWCWQQGCRLQWYSCHDNLIIYNVLSDSSNGYESVIQNIYNKQIIKTCKKPIYSISSNGENSVYLNFSRLHRLRPGYGYIQVKDFTEKCHAPADDGVWSYNFLSDESCLLHSLKDLSHFNPLPSMENANHYINHLFFNPSGTRFMFFHIWMKGKERYIRLLTSNLDGTDLYPLINTGWVSHYCWKSDSELLAYSWHSDKGKKYYLYEDQTRLKKVIGHGLLEDDGHPSFNKRNQILVDRYLEHRQYQALYLFDESKSQLNLLHFQNNFKHKYFGAERCDFHPRWSNDGEKIAFDCPTENYRKLAIMDLEIE